ncbi:helix-turn-helix domain-containing protein [Bradyrhizobium sp. HKCCYLS1011]|uniref:helix-turn-helix domain-containing protein n=1 Tax=Bradyrhizobium sp. HKCCYLS1011 TaxID=3420733 RepID=UPI003EB8AF08
MTLALKVAAKTKAQTPKQVVIEWIDYILDRKRWNATELARKAELAPSTLLRLLNNPEHPFLPTQKTLSKIADASGIPITKKVLEALGAETGDNGLEVPEGASKRAGLRPAAARTASVEFKHVSALPASLQAAASSRRDGYVPAPPQLDGDETGFAFHVPDDSFGLWLKAGSLCYGTKRRDPVAGDMILVTGKDGKSKVRLLTSIDEKGLVMTKTMPAGDEERMAFEDVAEIAIVAVIVRL